MTKIEVVYVRGAQPQISSLLFLKTQSTPLSPRHPSPAGWAWLARMCPLTCHHGGTSSQVTVAVMMDLFMKIDKILEVQYLHFFK